MTVPDSALPSSNQRTKITQKGFRGMQNTSDQEKKFAEKKENIDLYGVCTTELGMMLPEEFSFDEWSRLGDHILLVVNSSAWWLGDWLVYGQEKFADRYRYCIEQSSLGYQTLRNYAWVARNVPLSRRRDELSFQHHAEVAFLPAEEQVYWLDRAVKEKWSRNVLRGNLRTGRSRGRQEQEPVLLRIRMTEERQATWHRAAQKAGMEFSEWAAQQLDKAAKSEVFSVVR